MVKLFKFKFHTFVFFTLNFIYPTPNINKLLKVSNIVVLEYTIMNVALSINMYDYLIETQKVYIPDRFEDNIASSFGDEVKNILNGLC